MALIKQFITRLHKPQANEQQSVCNYANNYYGDRVCVAKAKTDKS
ncbi:hypothetical protein [Thalassotalea sp. LPB0316]|nr:hypothetical protein [Thalassotalea sp. LPB0316]